MNKLPRAPRKGFFILLGHGAAWLTLLLLLLTPGISRAEAASQIVLDNGVLRVTIDRPDAQNGFYHGTRFDWSGVIESLRYAGHDFYGRWFTGTDPAVHDFVFSGSQIIAGPCSAITGPVEEFVSRDGALGYTQAAAHGGTFIKIGVGVLEKDTSARYDSFHLYNIVDHGIWRIHASALAVVFRQHLKDPASGYGYIYSKTIRLLPGKPIMIIDHSLHNIGDRTIETDVYDHNFLVIDHQTIGPAYTITLPFTIFTPKPVNAKLGMIEENQIHYRQQLQDQEMFATGITGFESRSKDNEIRINDAEAGVGMRIRANRPLSKEELWSIRSVLAMEPYIHLNIRPGQTFHWRYHYQYERLPKS